MNIRGGRFFIYFAVAALTFGCTASRIFQTKVPAPIVKTEDQLDSERQGADLIAKTIETPVELKPVATALSTSLGAPKKSLFVGGQSFNLPQAANHASGDLQTSILQVQKQLDQLNIKLSKLQGKDIEGTGISILGPGMVTVVLVLIALGVFFPPALTLLAFAYRRLKATASIVVAEVEKAAKAPETQAAVAAIKKGIANKMEAHPISTVALENTILDLKKTT